MTPSRNGAQALLGTANAFGVRVCFANPGTTELTLTRALDDVPGIRPVLGLFEGVCTGAADGYARVSRRPALTLLHLGPGLANGLANLHNARRAHSSVINIVGDHATWHVRFDAPLASDIEGLARPVSGRVIRLDAAASIGPCVRAAVEASLTPPGNVVTLIAPSDLMDEPTSVSGTRHLEVPNLRTVPAQRIAVAAAKLTDFGSRTLLLLGAEALGERGLAAANLIAEATGARIIMETYPAIASLGGGLPRAERLAYFPQDAVSQIGEAPVLLAGALPPVSYFGYAGQPSEFVPANRLIGLASPGDDIAAALEQLAEALGARPSQRTAPLPEVSVPRSADLIVEVAEQLVEQLPEHAIVSLEGSTFGGPYLQRAHRARRHRVMTNTGGAIGQGLPCAVGAALAEPDARIVCLQSDGSAQYTLQGLWTLAREQLNVTVIIAANHRYGILQTELLRAGAQLERPGLQRMTRLDSPRIDWCALARGYGVPAVRAETAAEFAGALRSALAAAGPTLIEVPLP